MNEKLPASDLYQAFQAAGEAMQTLTLELDQKRAVMAEAVAIYQAAGEGYSLEHIAHIHQALKQIVKSVENIVSNLIDVVPYQDRLTDLDISPGVFFHNLATTKLMWVEMLVLRLKTLSQVESPFGPPSPLKHGDLPAYFLPEITAQTAGHLQAVLQRADLKKGLTIDLQQTIDPAQSSRNVIGARTFFSPILPTNAQAELEDAGIRIDPGRLPVSYRVVDPHNQLENWQSSTAMVESILYYLVSNATKKICPKMRTLAQPGQKVETTWTTINLKDQDFVALEVFDTGPHIDHDALYQQMGEALQSPNHVAHEVVQQVAGHIGDKAHSRQLNLMTVMPPTEVLYLRGFSAQGSTGIGLNEARFLTRSGGGAIMVNNVYGKESGVAVTVLFPKNATAEELQDLQALAEKIKSLLERGQLNLPTLDTLAA